MLVRITLAFLAVLALGVTLAGPCPAQSGQRAILARSGETSILIWNAFPYLKGLEGSSMSTQDAERELSSKAFAVLVEGSRPLKGARTVRLVTVIQKPSDQSSFVYRTTTFSDSQTLFTMEAKRADVLAKTALWSRELKSGSTPRNLKIAWDNHLPS